MVEASFSVKTPVPWKGTLFYSLLHCLRLFLWFFYTAVKDIAALLHMLCNGRHEHQAVAQRGMRLAAHASTTAINQGMQTLANAKNVVKTLEGILYIWFLPTPNTTLFRLR